MRVLLDTNILGRLVQRTHHHHVSASQAVEVLRRQGADLCIVPQVLYELWVVCTRPLSVNGLGLTRSETEAEFAGIKRLFRLCRDERAILQGWEHLVREHDVLGKSAHDARLVAAMMRHGLPHILTFNGADFKRYTEITVLSPDAVAQAAAPPSA